MEKYSPKWKITITLITCHIKGQKMAQDDQKNSL